MLARVNAAPLIFLEHEVFSSDRAWRQTRSVRDRRSQHRRQTRSARERSSRVDALMQHKHVLEIKFIALRQFLWHLL